MKPLIVRGRALKPQGQALICTPLIARTADALQRELANVLPKLPDLIEWRVDFFENIHDVARVVESAQALRMTAGSIPIIFTRRAPHEGGEAPAIAEEAVVALYEAVCASGAVDIIDYELSQSAEHRARLRTASRAHGVALILSHHDFQRTPAVADLIEKMRAAEHGGADIAKVAVMPQTPGDVLLLLEATLKASEKVGIPLITMSMGAAGAITRLCGWQYGSAMTFAVGSGRSAPGQIPIENLRAAMALLAPADSDKGG